MRRLTDDEKFLLALAEVVQPGIGVDPYAVAESIGMTPRRLEAIAVQLIRTNFIRRCGDGEVTITDHGLRLVKTLTST